jgi:prevent-host-death family protein
MATVGVRELKNRLSHFLRRVADGDRITVTDRGRPIAVIVSPDESNEVARAMAMVREGFAHWGGGTPRGSRRPIKVRGKPISQTVLDERR